MGDTLGTFCRRGVPDSVVYQDLFLNPYGNIASDLSRLTALKSSCGGARRHNSWFGPSIYDIPRPSAAYRRDCGLCFNGSVGSPRFAKPSKSVVLDSGRSRWSSHWSDFGESLLERGASMAAAEKIVTEQHLIPV